jgi:hypothetical protein
MKQRRDLTGQTFGWLTVRGLFQIRHRHSEWLCDCICGGHIVSRDTRLIGTGGNSKTVSCGCYRKDHDVRKAARLKVPVRKRRKIASMGGVGARNKRLESKKGRK